MKRITLNPVFDRPDEFILSLIDLDNVTLYKEIVLPFSRSLTGISIPTGTISYIFQYLELKPLNIPPL